MTDQCGMGQFPPILIILTRGTPQNSSPKRPEVQTVGNAVGAGPLHRRPDAVTAGPLRHKTSPQKMLITRGGSFMVFATRDELQALPDELNRQKVDT
jgi:hypothetical protein